MRVDPVVTLRQEQIRSGPPTQSVTHALLVEPCRSAVMGAWSLRSQLHEVAPWDIVSLFATALVLAVVAVLACAVPARRAVRTDPAEVLRAD